MTNFGKLQLEMRKNGGLADVLGARSLCVGDQKLFNFALELHGGLFYECACPDCVCTYQCLASISGKLDITRRVNSKMAGDEHGQAANSDA